MEKLTVEQVKKLALANYTTGGDAIVECWDDIDIQNWINEGNTLKDLKKLFSIREDVVSGINNTEW